MHVMLIAVAICALGMTLGVPAGKIPAWVPLFMLCVFCMVLAFVLRIA